jgi:hypothetical protein
MDRIAELELHDIIPLIALAALEEAQTAREVQMAKAPRSTSLSGEAYIFELLRCGNEKRIYSVLRMKSNTFKTLCDWLETNTPLRSSRHITIKEQVAIFLWIINFDSSIWQTAERFQHSTKTISLYCIHYFPSNLYTNWMYRYFHAVLQAVLQLYKTVIKLPTSETPLSPIIADDPKYSPYFENCVGALDGTHIAVHVKPQDQPRYRNRKGFLSQNVLAVCNFEMEFTYILAGWEGSAHDGAVYRSAQHSHGLITPPGKYWLGDAGYGNSDTILAPYRGTRYYLKEQYKAAKRPENSKELFNLRHASRRNVIERIFGVVKRKYSILKTPSEYSMATQSRIILACCTLHNFVRSMEGQSADILLDTEESNSEEPDDNQPTTAIDPVSQSSKKMDKFRDKIAEKMWTDYERYNKERERNRGATLAEEEAQSEA